MSDDSGTNHNSNSIFLFSDIHGDPITTDKNPAHFEGFLLEIEACIQRTGKFKPLVTQRAVCTSGGKTILDSYSSIPFFLKSVTGAKTYDLFDPCPPTAGRITSRLNTASG